MDRQNVSSALFLLLGLAGVSTEQNPRRREVHRAERLISANDAPILASALAGSDYLVTLDNEFFNPNVVAAAKGTNDSQARRPHSVAQYITRAAELTTAPKSDSLHRASQAATVKRTSMITSPVSLVPALLIAIACATARQIH